MDTIVKENLEKFKAFQKILAQGFRDGRRENTSPARDWNGLHISLSVRSFGDFHPYFKSKRCVCTSIDTTVSNGIKRHSIIRYFGDYPYFKSKRCVRTSIDRVCMD